MSEWDKTRREEDQRRHDMQDRDRQRFGQQGQRTREQRSFQSPGMRAVEEWDDPQRAYGDQGYGSQAYGRQEYSGSDADYQSYGGRSYEEQRYGSQRYGAETYPQRRYGGERYAEPGYAGRSFSEPRYESRREAERYGERGYRGGMIGDNEPLRRVSDGETDPALSGAFGGGMQKGLHRGRGPRAYTRSDERIREDVNDRLTDDSWLDASEIEVQVAKGEVTLTGTVNSRNDKRRAEDLADDVSGVKHVQNNLRVQTTAGQTMDTGGQPGAQTTGSSTMGQSAPAPKAGPGTGVGRS